MLRKIVHLVLAATLATASHHHASEDDPDFWPPLPPVVPGVGFDLTADYGTAAIFLRDDYTVEGSFVEVARIEGSSDYKAFMRKPHVEIPASALTDDSDGVVSKLRLQACSHLRQAGMDLCKLADPDFDSTHALLAALQSAVTSHLGTPFCFVGLSTPNRTRYTTTHQEAIIDRALKTLDLRLPSSRIDEASGAVIEANPIQDTTDPDVDVTDTVLAIDYSHSGLNMGIHGAELGHMVRHHYDLELGASRRADEQYRERLVASLRQFTMSPFGEDFALTPLTDEIKHVVLYGDSVDDENFLDILEAVIGKELVDGAARTSPVFAAARGMASNTWERINDLDFRVEPAPGCRVSSQNDEL